MRRIGLVCALRIEGDCLVGRGGQGPAALEGGPFEAFSVDLGDTEAFCVISGVGKAAAAAATQFLLERFPPLLVISFGLAGALEGSARVGDVVLPSAVLQADTGIYDSRGFQAPQDWAAGDIGKRLHHEHPADPVVHGWGLRFLEERGVEPLTGLLATCDQAVFSSGRRSELHRAFGAVAVDMESGAVAQVAELNRVPFAAFRAVSDAHGLEMEQAPGHPSFLEQLREGAARACARLGELLPAFVEGCPLPA